MMIALEVVKDQYRKRMSTAPLFCIANAAARTPITIPMMNRIMFASVPSPLQNELHPPILPTILQVAMGYYRS